MVHLQKVSEDVESIPIDQIKFDQVMIVDPRDYTISKWNARVEDQERNIASLTDSIINYGFINPLISDENKEIIDGLRRWKIAIKYGLKIPVIHKNYNGDETKKALDSLLYNMKEENTPLERAKLLDKLLKKGISLKVISEALGVSISQINNWLVQINAPKEIIPDNDLEAIESYKSLSERDRRTFNRAVKTIGLTPEESKEELKYFSKLTSRERDEYIKDIVSGMKVEKKDTTVAENKDDYELWNYYVYKKWGNKWKDKIRKRGWDRFKTINALMNGFYLGKFNLSQEEYNDLNSSGVLDGKDL